MNKQTLRNDYEYIIKKLRDKVIENLNEFIPIHVDDNIYIFKTNYGKKYVICERIENNDCIKYKKGFFDFRKYSVPLILYYDELYSPIIDSDENIVKYIIKRDYEDFPYIDFFSYKIDDEKFESERDFIENVVGIIKSLKLIIEGDI